MEHINEFNIFKNLTNEWSASEKDGKEIADAISNQYFEYSKINIDVEQINDKNIVVLTLPSLDNLFITYKATIIIIPSALRMKIQYINKADNTLSHDMRYKVPRHEDENSWVDTFYRLRYITDQYYGNIEQYTEIEKKLKDAMHEMSYDHRTSGKGVTFEKGELISIL